MTEVILVDEFDVEVGSMEKLKAHREGILHRAFSIFIFNNKGEMLLQKRANNKYHNPGLWTNTCCSHPLPNENILAAANRRLKEEMGFCTKIEKIFHFTYKAKFENGLTEYEFDHVFIGEYNGTISANQNEVSDFCYMDIDKISNNIKNHPDKFTAWFKIAFDKVILQRNSMNKVVDYHN